MKSYLKKLIVLIFVLVIIIMGIFTIKKSAPKIIKSSEKFEPPTFSKDGKLYNLREFPIKLSLTTNSPQKPLRYEIRANNSKNWRKYFYPLSALPGDKICARAVYKKEEKELYSDEVCNEYLVNKVNSKNNIIEVGKEKAKDVIQNKSE